MNFDWSQEYSVKNQKIDGHHLELFRLFDTFSEAITMGKNEEYVLDTLHDIKDYTYYHFSFEERAMKRANYPRYAQHKIIHDKFIADIDRMISEYSNADPLSISLKMYQLLTHWLQEHILKTDHQYEPYLRD